MNWVQDASPLGTNPWFELLFVWHEAEPTQDGRGARPAHPSRERTGLVEVS